MAKDIHAVREKQRRDAERKQKTERFKGLKEAQKTAQTAWRNYGTNTQRPALSASGTGYMYFDTTTGKPIWWTGTSWVDATGAAI